MREGGRCHGFPWCASPARPSSRTAARRRCYGPRWRAPSTHQPRHRAAPRRCYGSRWCAPPTHQPLHLAAHRRFYGLRWCARPTRRPRHIAARRHCYGLRWCAPPARQPRQMAARRRFYGLRWCVPAVAPPTHRSSPAASSPRGRRWRRGSGNQRTSRGRGPSGRLLKKWPPRLYRAPVAAPISAATGALSAGSIAAAPTFPSPLRRRYRRWPVRLALTFPRRAGRSPMAFSSLSPLAGRGLG
jgi:hypothetical protein